MKKWTGSKLGKEYVKEYVKVVYRHPAYLTYMQSTSCEMQGWMKHKLESRLLGDKQISLINLTVHSTYMELPLWLSYKASRICLQCERSGFNHWLGMTPWRREWLPTPVFLPGEFHGQRSLVSYIQSMGSQRIRHD